jgi:formate hydrogenlyase subunit 6/NADH:ubiquinone oxidoreductase subunit I
MFDMLHSVLANLISKPATRLYPQQDRAKFLRTRGCIDVDIDQCIFCGNCSRRCPAGAITVDRPQKTWMIDPYQCIVCGVCAEGCPKKCILINTKYAAPEQHKSVKVRCQAQDA